MPRYAITERAGPFVATYRNAGVGTVLDLTERQAEHELRLGTLLQLSEPDHRAVDVPDIEPAIIATAPPEHRTAPASEQEATVAPPSRKPKRSAT